MYLWLRLDLLYFLLYCTVLLWPAAPVTKICICLSISEQGRSLLSYENKMDICYVCCFDVYHNNDSSETALSLMILSHMKKWGI